MERYICPECGTEMDQKEIKDSPFLCFKGRANLICPKCNFILLKDHYEFCYNLGRFGVAKLPDTKRNEGKREVVLPVWEQSATKEKPPLGCKPYYVYIGPRIEDLCNAIVRCYADEIPNHNKIALWCKEILYLNEMDRNLLYDEKCKVWKEDKDGTLKEMP